MPKCSATPALMPDDTCTPVLVGCLPVHPVTLDDLLLEMDSLIRAGTRTAILYVNAHAVCIAEGHPEFRAAMHESHLVFCDGKAVQWASIILGRSLPERYSPPDWIDRLCDLATENSYRLFFLGGAEGVAAAAATRLQGVHPGLRIETHHGYFEKQGPETDAVVDRINEFQPEFLLVGFGMPTQEVWIADHIDRLNINVALSVGALFDFVSGHTARGPRWLTDHGFEWLTRLVREPRRLGRRYLLGNPRFLWIVLRQKISRRSA